MPVLPRSLLAKVACVLGLVCLLLGACGTDGPETTASQPADDTTTASVDSSTTIDDPTTKPETTPAPAPGTAQIRAAITTCDTTAAPVRCEMHVEEVLGYGSATPPLGTGDRSMALAPSLLDDRDIATIEALGPRTFVVRHAGDQPDFEKQPDDTKSAWTIQSLE
jgi:hypothetical protein